MSYREYLEKHYGKFTGKYTHIKDGKVCWSGDELLRGSRCPVCREKLSFYKPGELGRESKVTSPAGLPTPE